MVAASSSRARDRAGLGSLRSPAKLGTPVSGERYPRPNETVSLESYRHRRSAHHGRSACPARPDYRVRHSHFGAGVVVSSAVKDGDEEVTVAFVGGAGVKKLMQRFAKLEKV